MSDPYLIKGRKMLSFMWFCIFLQISSMFISLIWDIPAFSFFAYGMCFLIVFSAIYNLFLISAGRKKLIKRMRRLKNE